MKAPLYVTRVTNKLSADAIGRARHSGTCVYGETLASSIGRCMSEVKGSDQVYFITSPPIRDAPETPRQLMKSLA